MLGSLLPRGETRDAQISFPDYLRLWEEFGFNGVQYVMPSGGIGELTAIQAQRNPIVWACISVRVLVFSEIRFLFQQNDGTRRGLTSSSPELEILETPWPQATTGDLLARMEVDASMYGNSYWIWADDRSRLIRIPPTRVTIASADEVDPITGKSFAKRLVGYFVNDKYGQAVSFFLPEEICHYKPLPDPAHEFRGASWLNALLPDVIADLDLTDYKHAFLQNAATPNLVVTFPETVGKEAFEKFRDKMETKHTGPQQGFKTLYMGGGADVKTVGSNFADLAMNAVQSAGETRIAAAAGVPASIVGLAEALRGSALNAGNYAATRRRFSDGTIRPLWRGAAGSLSTLINVPAGSRLWYDDSDVMFLQEDLNDQATQRGIDATTILSLIQAGYTPESVVQAVDTGDLTVLEHTGLVSVQLQKTAPIPAGGTNEPDPTLANDPPTPALPPAPAPGAPPEPNEAF
jgi:phage portal protein BeeE